MVLVLAVLIDGWMEVLSIIVDLWQLCPEPSTHVQRQKISNPVLQEVIQFGLGFWDQWAIINQSIHWCGLVSEVERKVLVRIFFIIWHIFVSKLLWNRFTSKKCA